jgi:sialic acid synthase SpsE
VEFKELLANYDATQVQLMQERCIIVDENDQGKDFSFCLNPNDFLLSL